MGGDFDKGLVELGDGIYAWMQPDGGWGWSNAGLVTDGDRSLLIDTLFDLRLTAEMLDAMKEATKAAVEIDTVVNTHANGDHCFGNELAAGAEIVGSRRTAQEMSEAPPDRLAALVAAAPDLGRVGDYVRRIFGPFHFGGITLTTPTTVFDGEHELRVGDRRVHLIEVGPAHTGGDTLVHLPDDRIVFAGDILFHGGTPIIWAGPVENWIAACDRILAMDVDVVVPGHGPVAGKAAVSELQGYLEFVRGEARTRFDAGMSPIAAARDIDLGPYATWGESERIVVNVTAMYRQWGGQPADDVVTLFSEMAELAFQ